VGARQSECDMQTDRRMASGQVVDKWTGNGQVDKRGISGQAADKRTGNGQVDR
jgi:hypothetical protein